MKSKIVIEMDYDELEVLVNKHYNIPLNKYGEGYSFVATQECGNDSSHTFAIPEVELLSDWDEKHIEELRAGKNPTYCNATILQDLVNAGVLQPGEYLIKVCW